MSAVSPGGAIDMHAHFYGETLMRALSGRRFAPAVESDGEGRRWLVAPTARFPVTPAMTDPATRVAMLDDAGIERQLLTFPGALGADALPAAEAKALLHDCNDELAAVRETWPARFATLAGLPFDDPDAAIAELERACAVLGHRGFILPANFLVELARLDALLPLLQAADSLRAHIMVHAGLRPDELGVGAARFADLQMHRASSIALQTSMSHATLTLMYSDLSERFPGLTIQVINLGGVLPFLVERMDLVVASRRPEDPKPSQLAPRVYVDSASFGPRAIALAAEVFGSDRVLLGSDCPIFPLASAVAAVETAELEAEQRQAIRCGNARRLLGGRGEA